MADDAITQARAAAGVARADGARPVVRALLVLTVALQLGYLVTLVVPGVDTALDAWLTMAAEWAAVLMCAASVATSRASRAVPALVSAAVAMTVLGDTLYLVQTGPDGTAPFPSAADGPYLFFYVLLLGAVLLIARRHLVTPTASVVFDVVIGSLGLAALLALVLTPVLDAAGAEAGVVEAVLAAAYPLLDLLLVATLVAVGASDRSGAGWRLLAAGLLLFGGADVVFALQVPDDGYVVGSLLDAAWALGVLAMAVWVVAATGAPDRPVGRATATRAGSALSLAAMVTSLAVLVIAPLVDGSVVAVVLAMGALLTTVVSVARRRGLLTPTSRQGHSRHTLRELRSPLSLEQIVLRYQPKLRLATGRIDAVEALARWNHPTRGLLGAGEFVPLLPEAGVLREWTTRILTLALDDAARWRDRGTPVSVAVNVTWEWLQDADAVAALLPTFAERCLAPSVLTLEITEQSLVADPTGALRILAPLRAAGVRIALDDFGTGYNSLSALHELPVDEVKIDRSFVDEMVADPRARSLVRATISLARDLGSETVAEGVQTQGQLTLLAELGCSAVQGYLIAEPLTAERIDDLLASPTTPTAPLRERPTEENSA